MLWLVILFNTETPCIIIFSKELTHGTTRSKWNHSCVFLVQYRQSTSRAVPLFCHHHLIIFLLFSIFLLIFLPHLFLIAFSHFLTITGRFHCYWIDGLLLRSISTRCAAGRSNTIAQLAAQFLNFIFSFCLFESFFFLSPILSNSGSRGLENKKTNARRTSFFFSHKEPLGQPILQTTGPPPSVH